MKRLLLTADGVVMYAWLGGTQQEGRWLWTDGSPGINCLVVSSNK